MLVETRGSSLASMKRQQISLKIKSINFVFFSIFDFWRERFWLNFVISCVTILHLVLLTFKRFGSKKIFNKANVKVVSGTALGIPLNQFLLAYFVNK